MHQTHRSDLPQGRRHRSANSPRFNPGAVTVAPMVQRLIKADGPPVTVEFHGSGHKASCFVGYSELGEVPRILDFLMGGDQSGTFIFNGRVESV